MRKKFVNGGKICFDKGNPKIQNLLPENERDPRKLAAKGGRIEYSKGTMPARNKKNFRPTEKGAGMTQAGVKAYRRLNPGSKLKRQGLKSGAVARGCGAIMSDRKKKTRMV